MRKHFPGEYDILVQVQRESELYPERGLGLTYSHGCLGSKCGDDRSHYFKKARVILPFASFKLSVSWWS